VAGSTPSTPSLTARLGELHVDGAQLRWNDQAASKPVQLTALADARLTGLVVGKPAPPATFHAALSVDGTVAEAVIDGDVAANPDAPALRATIAARGVRAGALAPYLPPGVELSTTDGRLKATLEASTTRHPQGGVGAQLVVSNVEWRDGEQSPLLAMDSFRIVAPRIDVPGNVIAIDEVTLAGLRTRAELGADGSTQALGLTLRTPPASAPQPANQQAAAPAVAVAAASPTTAPAQPQETARLVAEARRPLPNLSLKKLDLNLSEVTVKDLRQPDAAPLSFENLRVSNPQPIEIGGADAESKPPVHLQIAGKINPLVNAFAVSTVAAPFAQEPTGTIDITASGIRGSGITELRPDLASALDGSGLTDGQFKAQLQVRAKLDRRGARYFDLSKPFQLDALINGLQFRDGAGSSDAPVLAGVELIQADEVKVDSRNGTVIVKSLEIMKPSARAYRDEKGIHALGLVIPSKAATTQPSTAPSEPALASASESPEVVPPAPTEASKPDKPSGEVRIDRFIISGIDVRVEDRSVEPPVIVPLNNLDVDVRGLTTLALSEPRTIRFDAVVNADKVPLPARPKEEGGGVGGGILGALGSAARLAGAKKPETTTEPTMEERELFSQIAASGQLTLYPAPSGRVKTAVNGVELAAFKGLAKEFNVDLDAGVFDATADVSFDEAGDMRTRAKPMVTDLKIDEPSGGVMSKYLKVPLNVAIPAIRDTSGTITVPLNFKVEKGKLSTGEILGAASGAFLSVVTTAVASAPVKAATGLTEMVGLGGLLGKKDKGGPDPVEIRFAPGSTTIDPDAQARLSALVQLARRDQNMQLTIHHELGGGDVAIAEQRANPPVEDATAMAARLRTRKIELANARAQLAGRVRAQIAWLPPAQGQAAIEELRGLDRQIAQTEQSLDQLYDLMRPGADRQAARRTRAAGIQIGQDRVSAVSSLLQPKDLPGAADRVHAAGAQFNPTEGGDGGRIIVTAVTKGQ
jgi:hypothetical protein